MKIILAVTAVLWLVLGLVDLIGGKTGLGIAELLGGFLGWTTAFVMAVTEE